MRVDADALHCTLHTAQKPPRRIAQLLLDFQQRQQLPSHEPAGGLLADFGVSAATTATAATAADREFCDAPPLTLCVLSKIERDRDSEIPRCVCVYVYALVLFFALD